MIQQGKSVIIENPMRSWLWELPPYKHLLSLGMFDVCLQNCKFSTDVPSRPKWSKFRTNIPEFKTLGGPCRLSHVHLPWGIKKDGVFATSEEAAYPKPLCKAMAEVIVRHVNTKWQTNFSIYPNNDVFTVDKHKKRRLAGFAQPRGKRLPALVSEFKAVVTLHSDEDITPFHKLLRYDTKGGESSEQLG
jgi:hypothetical protein